jgi:transcriptional regulator with XRE-family HTH domain
MSRSEEKPEWAGIGERLALLRSAFNESQRDVAKEVDAVHATIARFEREKSTVDLTQLFALARHFRVEVAWLLQGTGRIFRPTNETVHLGSAYASQPCRSALELILQEIPGRCMLIEDHESEADRFAWLLETRGTLFCILPGEVKPGFIARALVDFALKNWNIRGSIDINKLGKDALVSLEHKTLPHSTLRQWLTAAPQRTDLDALWQLGTPPALAETVKPIFERLKAQGEMSKEQMRETRVAVANKARTLADLAEKYDEVAEHMSRLLAQYDLESAGERSKRKKQGA